MKKNIEKFIIGDESCIWKYALINKEKIYITLLDMIKYHRKNMELEVTCILVLQTLAMINKFEKDLDDASINTLILRILTTTKVLRNLSTGYRKLNIEMLDLVINNITQWISDEEDNVE